MTVDSPPSSPMSDALPTLRTFGILLAGALGVLLAIRSSTVPDAPELGVILVCLVAVVVSTYGAARWWTVSAAALFVVCFMGTAGILSHALLPGVVHALSHLGVLFVVASLLLRPRAFVGVSVGLLIAATGSRLVRIQLGHGGPDPAAPFMNTIAGLTAFSIALWVLDRQHRKITEALRQGIVEAEVARREAESVSHAKGRFLANMSHELRTPMNAILGYAELLEEDVEPAQREILGQVQRAGHTLLREIDHVLEHARLESESPSPTAGPTGSSARAPSADRDVLRRWLMLGGSFIVVVDATVLCAMTATNAPISFLMPMLTLALGSAVVVMGWRGRVQAGVASFMVGAAIILGAAQAYTFEGQGLHPYAFFAMAVAALAMRVEPFRWVLAALMISMALGGYARWLQGWEAFRDVLIPWVGTGLVAWAIQSIVLRRNREGDALATSAEEASRALALAFEVARARERFIERMSHQVRTPLTTVIGYAELLEEELQGQANEDARRIRAAGAHLLQTVDAVMDLRKVTAGDTSFAPEPVLVEPVVQAVLDLCRSQVEARENQLSCDLEEGAVFYGDAGLVRQILVNLVNNAGKFTRQGSVRVEVHAGDPVSIAVIDTGTGLTSAEIDRLFQPFERLSAGPQIEGTGLGLAISRQLAELHGGSLTVESEPGWGSRFTLLLPASQKP